MKKLIFFLLLFISILSAATCESCVEIIELEDYYLITNFSSAFSTRDLGIVFNPIDYDARLVGQVVDSWSYDHGVSLAFEGGDSWSLGKVHFSEPERSGIVVRNLNTGELQWFITDFMCPESKEKWERITDPNCEDGGGDPVLVFPLAPPGYIDCLGDPNDIDDDGDGVTENEGDCNDFHNDIFPGAIEICGDWIDQNCDGLDLLCEPVGDVDVVLVWDKPDDIRVVGYYVYYGKADTDFKSSPYAVVSTADITSYTFLGLEVGLEYFFAATSFDAEGNESDFSEIISYIVPDAWSIDDDNDGYTENEGDCSDTDPSIYPGAEEICGDGIDQDCDGYDLDCEPIEECVSVERDIENKILTFFNANIGFSGFDIRDGSVYAMGDIKGMDPNRVEDLGVLVTVTNDFSIIFETTNLFTGLLASGPVRWNFLYVPPANSYTFNYLWFSIDSLCQEDRDDLKRTTWSPYQPWAHLNEVMAVYDQVQPLPVEFMNYVPYLGDGIIFDLNDWISSQ